MGMIGLSCYILADTFFIANAIGADGLTALNIAIPVYNLINAAGLMTGVGGGTRYAILRAQGENEAANRLFSGMVLLAAGAGCDMVIANGEHPDVLYDIVEGKDVGTRFLARPRG